MESLDLLEQLEKMHLTPTQQQRFKESAESLNLDTALTEIEQSLSAKTKTLTFNPDDIKDIKKAHSLCSAILEKSSQETSKFEEKIKDFEQKQSKMEEKERLPKSQGSYESRVKEIKSKLSTTYSGMVRLAEEIDFESLGKAARPGELQPSFDRYT